VDAKIRIGQASSFKRGDVSTRSPSGVGSKEAKIHPGIQTHTRTNTLTVVNQRRGLERPLDIAVVYRSGQHAYKAAGGEPVAAALIAT
jgi:hypothetical protein